MQVATGLTRLAFEPELSGLIQGARIGLLAHPASADSRFVHASRVLRALGAEIGALFGPEHGYAGQAQDMIGIDNENRGQVPVYSLYGATFDDLSPRPEWLDELDAVVIDLQDVGARYYTFVWTAALMMLACAHKGVRTIVLDRPNPLGGAVLEGAPQRPGNRSFVGLYDVPVRHGMTLGEITAMVHALEGLDPEALTVVGMAGYHREMLWRDTELPWVLPSPNMPTPDTALVYPGGCLLEGTNLSEGRGTTRPFEICGAPFLDAELLTEHVNGPGAVLRALSFEPTFHKHAKTLCQGVQVHVTNPHEFRSYALYTRLIVEAARQAPDHFAFRTEPYEYVADRPAIDLLTGGSELRTRIAAGAKVDDLLEADDRAVQAFDEVRKQWLLYG
jgi:uncharacterized protein YbbC (DUF1343 family)